MVGWHWVVGGLFFVAQLGAYTRFRFSISRLLQQWDTWRAQYQPLVSAPNDLVDVLNNRLHESHAYLFLSRMNLMAPLLGVVITAVGFISLPEVSPGTAPAGAAPGGFPVASIRPLYQGVLIGSILALINQALLHVAAVGIARALRTAEAACARSVTAPPTLQASQQFAIAAKEAALTSKDLAVALRDAIGQLTQNTITACAAIAGAVQALEKTVANADTTINAAARRCASGMGGLASTGVDVTGRLLALGSDIQRLAIAAEAICQDTSESGKHSREAARGLLEAGNQLAQYIRDELNPSVKQLNEHLTFGTALVEGMVQRAAEEMGGTARSLAPSFAALQAQVRELSEACKLGTDTLSTARLGTTSASQELAGAVSRVTTSLGSAETGITRTAQACENAMSRLATSGAGFAQGFQTLDRDLQQLLQLLQRLRDTSDARDSEVTNAAKAAINASSELAGLVRGELKASVGQMNQQVADGSALAQAVVQTTTAAVEAMTRSFETTTVRAAAADKGIQKLGDSIQSLQLRITSFAAVLSGLEQHLAPVPPPEHNHTPRSTLFGLFRGGNGSKR